MYESLIQWCRFPVNIHAFTGMTASGDSTHAASIVANGYRVDKVETITDKYGKQYASNTQVYFPAAVVITEADYISFEDTVKHEIHSIISYYDGNTGLADMKVIYL